MSIENKFKVVVPARLGSTRLPNKVIREINGIPVFQYVLRASAQSGAEEIVLAVDDDSVAALGKHWQADVEMTSTGHESGTDRIHQVAVSRAWADSTIVVNVQGDEPLMPPQLIGDVAKLLADDAEADIATLCHAITNQSDWENPNVVKVVRDGKNRAHYFSRAPIPWLRNGSSANAPLLPEGHAFRHIGIYAYRVSALKKFAAMSPAPTEKIENLEQLRALWHGLKIAVGVANSAPPRGVDTEADFDEVSRLILNQQ